MTDEARAERRVALVVGNGNYVATPKLTNPTNDAQDVAALLKELGFEVILETNLDKRAMDSAFARFARLARDSDAALFYYAGHGIQREGRNFLMPIDAKLEDDISIRFEMVGLDSASDALAGARGVKIMILDACRNNPVAERLQSRAATRGATFNLGLANQQVRGMVVVYATQPNDVAADGEGRNSPFTAAFIESAREPGVRIADMLVRVSENVSSRTDGRQIPEFTASGSGRFILNLRETDSQAWQRARGGSTEQIQDFIRQYPNSIHFEDARLRLESMSAEKARRDQALAAQAAFEAQQSRLLELQAMEAAAREAARAQRAAAEASLAEQRARVRQLEASEAAARQQRAAAQAILAEQQAQAQALQEQLQRAQIERDERYAPLWTQVRVRLPSPPIRAIESLRWKRSCRACGSKWNVGERDAAEAAAKARAAEDEVRRVRANHRTDTPGVGDRSGDDRPTLLAALPPPGAAVVPARPAITRLALVTAIKSEFARLGCYSGTVDGNWDASAFRTARETFARRARVQLASIQPTSEFLESLTSRSDRVCPLICRSGQVAPRWPVCCTEQRSTRPSAGRSQAAAASPLHPTDWRRTT